MLDPKYRFDLPNTGESRVKRLNPEQRDGGAPQEGVLNNLYGNSGS